MAESLTLDKLESYFWESANILRGSIDSSNYKNYIFGLLFLKRISDVFYENREKIRRGFNGLQAKKLRETKYTGKPFENDL